MAKRIAELFVTFQLYMFLFAIKVYGIEFTDMLSKPASEHRPTKYVIFDTDMGGDDAWALQFVLKAEKEFGNVQILAITTTFGNSNVTNAIKNTYRILDGLNRTDIPIYKGSSEAIIPINTKNDHFFGKNGFSDIDVWKPHYPRDINSIIQKENAIEIIRDVVMQHPHKISLLCVGPLTNIALAVKIYPEIQKNIKEIISMGGSFTGRGNVVPAAEFNFYLDPEAVFIILNSLIRPILILPLDAYDEQLSTNWRFEVVGKVNGSNVELLNEIEIFPYRKKKIYWPYDAFTAAAFLFPEKMIQKCNPYNATMELHGYYTRGEMFVNRQSTDFKVFIIEKIFADEFKKIMLWAANFN